MTDLGLINDEEVQVHRDVLEIFQTKLETLKKYSVMLCQDDYESWKTSQFNRRGGKPLLVDQADYLTQHIFFDDNAGEDFGSCVDVRDMITGKPLNYQKVNDMYVVKVQPHKALLENDYFIKAIENAEALRDEEIQRFEAGLEDNESSREDASQLQQTSQMSKKGETEWEKMQKLPDADYLMRTVLPVLYQGMRVVDLERPAAPLE